MKVKVLSKNKFDEILNRIGIGQENVCDDRTQAFISIINSDLQQKSYFDTNTDNVLVLTFDDATDLENQRRSKLGLPDLKLFTRQDAQDIIDFIERNRDIETLWVHCSAGRSRSGAVGTFANDVWGKQTFREFLESNPTVSPNYFILALLRRVYNNIEDGD